MKKMICCFGLLFMVLGGERNNLDAQLAGDDQGQGIERSAGQQRNIPGGRLRVTDVAQDGLLQKKISELIALLNNSSPNAGLIRVYAVTDLVKIGQPAVEPLLSALENENKDVRSSAVRALGQIGDARAFQPLIKTLEDEDKDVRSSAAVALGQIGDTRAFQPLIDALKDGNENVRSSAVRALGRMGNPQAVSAIIDALKDEHRYVRSSAAAALGRMGNPQAVQPLIDALEDEDALVCSYAVNALSQIGNAQAVKALIKALESEDRNVSSSVVRALGQMGNPQAVQLIINALKDENKNVRASAARALGQIGDARAFQPLIKTLEDEDKDVRSSVALALGQIGDVRAVEPLFTLKDEDQNVRSSASVALFLISNALDPAVIPPKTVRVLIQELDNTDKQVRSMAVLFLGTIGDPQAVKPLISVIKDKDRGVPEFEIRHALVEIGKPAVPALINFLADKDDAISSNAARVLGQIGDTQAVGPLIKAMERYAEEKSQSLSFSFIGDALAKIGDAHSVQALIDFVQDESANRTIRSVAVRALAQTSNPQAVPVLINALKDENNNFRTSAMLAIAGSDFEMKRTFAARAIANDTQVVQLFISALEDKNVRRQAIQALGVIGDARAVEPLLKILEDDQQDWLICNIAARAVGSIGTAQGVQVLINNVEAEKNSRPKSEVYNVSLIGLDLVTSPEAIPALIKALENKSNAKSLTMERLHEKVTKALTIIGSPAVPPLLDILKEKDRYSPEAARILRVLQGIGIRMVGVGQHAQIWPQMSITLGMQTSTTVDWAIQEEVMQLIAQLSATYDRRMGHMNVAETSRRRYASETLIKIGKPAVQPLINALEDQGNVKKPAVQPPINVFEDERYLKRDMSTGFFHNYGRHGPYDIGMRGIIVRALGEIGDRRAVEPLINVLQVKDEETSTLGIAARSLGEIGDPQAVDALAKILKDNDDDNRIRGIAARSLGEIGDRRAVESLIDALDDKDAGVRIDVVWALGAIGDARAVKPLKNALTDSVIYVKSAAKEAMQKIVP